MKLTKKSIDAIKSEATDRIYWDDELRGFGLRVKQSGLRSFLIQFRNRQGRSRRLTVGNYGRLTPEEARKEARRLLSDVERGIDPVEQRVEERNVITVTDLSIEYLAKAEAGLIIGRKGLPKKVSTLEIDRGRIARHIVPLLGKKPLKHLTSADIRRFLEAVMSGKTAATVKTKPRGLARVTGGPTAAVRAVGLLGGMLSYAKEMGYIEHSPTHRIRKPADKRRAFRLGLGEYLALGEALEAAERRGEHWQAIAAIRLLALMLLRTDFDHARSRGHLFANCPAFACKVVLTTRIRWFEHSNGSPSFNHAWYIWDWQHRGKAILEYHFQTSGRIRTSGTNASYGGGGGKGAEEIDAWIDRRPRGIRKPVAHMRFALQMSAYDPKRTSGLSMHRPQIVWRLCCGFRFR